MHFVPVKGFTTSFVNVAITSLHLTPEAHHTQSWSICHLISFSISKNILVQYLVTAQRFQGKKKILATFPMCWVLFNLGAPSGTPCPSHFLTGLFPALPSWIGHHGKLKRQKHNIFNPFMFAHFCMFSPWRCTPTA